MLLDWGSILTIVLSPPRYLMKCCAKLASGEPVLTPTAAYLSASAMDTECSATSSYDFKNPQTLIFAYRHRAAR